MKKSLLIMTSFIALFAFSSCQSDQVDEEEMIKKAENLDPTTIEFSRTEYDFGTVEEGEKVEYRFEFTNTGDKNLVIVDAKGSCGCTVPTYPKEPILPGAKGEIYVVFDSKNRVGEVKKSVTVVANTNPTKNVLYLVGKVEE